KRRQWAKGNGEDAPLQQGGPTRSIWGGGVRTGMSAFFGHGGGGGSSSSGTDAKKDREQNFTTYTSGANEDRVRAQEERQASVADSQVSQQRHFLGDLPFFRH
ncbi:MAG: hypothetical protein AAFY57_20665, partial [Cyanobacteria bacterium J06642_2]